MFGFPINSQGDINKYTNDADSGFPKIQQREVFYSVKDGLWSDLNTWQTASGRVGLLPNINDDVYIRNIVTIFSPPTINVRNLYISNKLLFTNGSILLNVNNVICDNGILDMSVGSQLNIRGNESRINKNNFIIGSGVVTVGYVGDIDQNILDLNYRNLTIYSTIKSNKTLISDITLLGNLQIGGAGGDVTFELSSYNLTVTGNLTLGGGNGGGRLRKSSSGNVLFIGTMGLSANGIDFSGNPNVEMRGGGTFGSNLITGSGTWTFTTNNQSINVSSAITADCNFIIGSGVTVNFFNNSPLTLNKPINGVDSTSKLLMGGATNSLYFATQDSAENSMTTGIVDFTTNANTIGYTGNYSATIPSRFPTFHNLTISGTGTKTLGVNTTLNGNLNLIGNNIAGQAGILECSTYNLSVFGQTLVGQGGGKGSTLSKNGAGNLLFVGLVDTDNLGGKINLTGNPNVEMRGGYNNNLDTSLYSGTGTWTFTTNNQSITGGYGVVFSGNVVVSGAITITNSLQVAILGTLDGNNINSKWLLNNILDLYNSTTPFATLGSIDYTTNTTAKIGYRFNGNFTLPATTYQGIRIGGTGTKTLSGNTLIQQTLELMGNQASPGTEGILECSTYNLQVNSTTTLGPGATKGATLSKNGIGSLLFIGAVVGSNGGDKILLTGNPTIEFRNGFNGGGGTGSSFNFGNGLITFSTNNQTCYFYTATTFQNNILISGAITLSMMTGQTYVGTINGDNVSSKFLVGANFTSTYNNATKPMATGILDTSTNLNTWIYGNANQDILGGPSTGAKQVYRNLTLNGGGTKTLQGYVSVLNTYTLTAPATLNNNGFSLTNP